MSEVNPEEVDKSNQPRPQAQCFVVNKTGIIVFGYSVPWWVIIMIVLLILYIAYEQGYLVQWVGKPSPVSEVSLNLSGDAAISSSVLSNETKTPEELKKLFRRRN